MRCGESVVVDLTDSLALIAGRRSALASYSFLFRILCSGRVSEPRALRISFSIRTPSADDKTFVIRVSAVSTHALSLAPLGVKDGDPSTRTGSARPSSRATCGYSGVTALYYFSPLYFDSISDKM